MAMVLQEKLHSCAELMEYINKIGFLPLLPLGIRGWSAEEVVDDDCQYVQLPEGGLPHHSFSGGVEAKDIEAAVQDSASKNR